MCLPQNLLANPAAALQQIASSESTVHQIQHTPLEHTTSWHHYVIPLLFLFFFPADPEQYLVGLQGVPDEETMMNLAIALSLQEEVYTRASLSYTFPMNL